MLRNTLEFLGHPQPPTPIQTDNSCAEGIVNDTVMGGRSSSRIEMQDGVLTFKGTLNTNGGGFASIRSGPLRLDADNQDRVRLRARGDGRTYQVRLTAGSTGTTYRALFDTEAGTWQTFDIPLQQFQAFWRGRLLDRPPRRAKEIDGVGILLADGKDGPLAVSIDWTCVDT